MSEEKKSIGTILIHGDDKFAEDAVAPAISVSTTFRAPHNERPVDEDAIDWRDPPHHVYSRYTQSTSSRAEIILSEINEGFALTYASGQASTNAALTFFAPKRVAVRGGYHGTHSMLDVYKKIQPNLQIIDIDDDFQEGDLCWLETPINPFGESKDISAYAKKVHAAGGKLLVDSTFGPPPLQYAIRHGADIVMHSGTKYFGGHSDLLCGILIAKTKEDWDQLWHNRTFMGNMMGSLESWLLVRSLRTLHLRVPRQSESATILADWFNKLSVIPEGQTFDGVPGGIVQKVFHSSLQGVDKDGFDPKTQMVGGWNPTFSILLATGEHAFRLQYLLEYFVAATSLGGIESLVEQRLMSDPSADPRLVRLSIGVEDVSDLKKDLRNAFVKLAKDLKTEAST